VSYLEEKAARKQRKHDKQMSGKPGFIGWILVIVFCGAGFSHPTNPLYWLLTLIGIFALVLTIARKIDFAKKVKEERRKKVK
jgi:hypothetical protein